MAAKSSSLDYWRNYFRNANSDIFGIIDCAILVAASDCPKEFRLRRDRIAEQLFSCRLTRCLGCDRVELAVPGGGADGGDGGERGSKSNSAGDRCEELEAGGSKESKAYSSRDEAGEMNLNQVSNYSFGEAEALTDEIDQQSEIAGEVLRIKEILDNFQDQSDSVLFESLRRLELMALSVDTLQATAIGKTVIGLRKHVSKRVRNLARVLITEWRELVDEWVKASADDHQGVEEVTPDSKNKSALEEVEEENFEEAFPPLDEAVFFTTQPTSMELSQFFDGMDDDGNPRNGGELMKNDDDGRQTSNGNQIVQNDDYGRQTSNGNRIVRNDDYGRQTSNDYQNPSRCKEQTAREVNVIAKEEKSQPKEQVVKPNKPSSNMSSGPLRPQKIIAEPKDNLEKRKPDRPAIPRRIQQDKVKCSDEDAVQMKLEATKRRLHESYQQAENAKKQRTIQVMELRDLPKQGLGHRNPHLKSGGPNRHWANGRR